MKIVRVIERKGKGRITMANDKREQAKHELTERVRANRVEGKATAISTPVELKSTTEH